MSISESMNPDPITCAPDTPVSQVARIMGQNRIGSVIVVDDGRRPVGIVTDRDLAVRVVGTERAHDTPVAEVMTVDPVTMTVAGSLADAVAQLAARGCRRLPVIDADARRLVGVFTLDDALLQTIENVEALARVVSEVRREPGTPW